MPILNYTTKVSADKTVAEIQRILGSKGATHVSVDYAEGRPTAVTFGFMVVGREVSYRLPCSANGVSAALKSENRAAGRDPRQCERVAWRIIKDWVAAQMALVEARQAEAAEVFLPYAVHSSGQTMFQAFKSQQLALTDGGE